MKSRLLAALLALLAGCSSGAPAPTPSTQPADAGATAPPAAGDEVALLPDPAAEHTLGETITLTGGEIMGDQARLLVEQAVRLPHDAGGPRYAFLVSIDGLDAESTPYNMLDFSLFDDEDFEYQAESGGRQPELTFGDLGPGDRVRGWVTFDGPPDPEHLELEYAPVLVLDPVRVRVLVP